jgi:hypothetical protein
MTGCPSDGVREAEVMSFIFREKMKDMKTKEN